MAAEEKLGVPSNEFFAAVKYHAVGSLQDQVSLTLFRLFTLYIQVLLIRNHFQVCCWSKNF